jgi:uncharacterized membrane protein
VTTGRIRWACVSVILLSFVAGAVLYSRLPDPMPSHWDAYGHINGYLPKPFGVFLLPTLMAAICGVFSLLPQLSPRGYRMGRFEGAYGILTLAVVCFLGVLQLFILASSSGVPIRMSTVVPGALGVLFVVMGSFMSKLTRNFFVGIRTPWTLASEEVWLRTHRLGGATFVLGGIVLVVASLLGGGPLWVLIGVAIAALVPAVYSFIIYRRLEPRA